MMIIYGLKVNLSVAMVAMVKPIDKKTVQAVVGSFVKNITDSQKISNATMALVSGIATNLTGNTFLLNATKELGDEECPGGIEEASLVIIYFVFIYIF